MLTQTLAPRHRQDLLDGLASVVKEVVKRKKISNSNPRNPCMVYYGIIDLYECLVYMVNVDKFYQSLCK